MPDDRVSLHAMSESEDNASCSSVENGGPSSRPPTPQNKEIKKAPVSSKRKRVSREESESSNDSDSENSNSDNDSDSKSGSDSESENESVGRTVRYDRSVVTETLFNASYTRFNPEISSKKSKGSLSNEQLNYCKRYFRNFVKDEVIQNNILDTAPIPDDPLFKVKTMDEFVMPTMAKIGVDYDRGAEKGIQSIQKRILRTMGPVSKLWQLVDGIRERSKHNDRVDDVDIEAMCQYVEKSVCLLGQASLAVDRHRRINTLVKITDDYKKAKDLLDDNEQTLAAGSSKLFGDDFKKVLKKASKTLDDATIIVKGIGGKRKGRKKHKFGSKRFRSDSQAIGRRPDHYPRDRSRDNKSNHYNDPFLSGPSERPNYSGAEEDVEVTEVAIEIKTTEEPINQTDHSQSKQSSNWRKTEILSQELANNHQRSLHTRNCRGISIGIRKSTNSRNKTKNPEFKCKRNRSSIKRNSESITKRSSRDCKFRSESIFKSKFRSSKKGRGKPSCNKFKEFKQLCELPPFQDGGSVHAKRSSKTKRLVVQDRFKRCLSNLKRSTRGSDLSPVHMGSDNLPVQIRPIRIGLSTKNFHKNFETSRRPIAKGRNTSNNLFRRHSFNGRDARKISRKQRHDNFPFTKLGFYDKLGKVKNNAMSEFRVFGDSNGHNSHDLLFTRVKGTKNKKSLQSSPSRKENNGTRNSKINGNISSNSSSNITSKSTVQVPANVTYQSNDNKQKLRICSRTNKRSSYRNNLVARANRCFKWPGNYFLNPRYSNNFRCIKQRLGGRLSRCQNRRCLDCSRIKLAHQRKRTSGSFLCNKSLYKNTNKQISAFENRQYNSSCLYKQNGRNKIDKISSVNERNLGVLSTKKYNHNSRTLTRETEYNCGLGIKKHVRFQRLDVRQKYFQNNYKSIRPMQNRLICKSVKLSNSKIRKLAARSRCFGNRRLSDFMAQYRMLCVPTILFDRQMLSKNTKRKGNYSVNIPSVASPVMVSTSLTHVNGGPNQNSMSQQSIDIVSRANASSNERGELEPCGMEGYRGSHITSSLSEEARELHREAWRPGTRASYKSAWSRWVGWCNSRQIDPFQTSVVNIIEFLTLLFNENKQYRTINTYRSAISKSHRLIDGVPVGQHRHIVHHMRAIFNVRTPMPRYQNSWNVDTVLQFIQQLGDNMGLSLKQLTHKLAILLALTSAGRASELHKLNIEFMLDKGDFILFKIPSLTKTCKPGKMLPEQKFYTYDDKNICVVECIRSYLQATTEFRLVKDNINRKWLLLSIVKPHHPVTISSISRWVKCIIQDAGIDTNIFKAHSTRAASTSKASLSGLSTREIMEHANWSKESTFTRFYNKPLLEDRNEYQNAVLSRS